MQIRLDDRSRGRVSFDEMYSLMCYIIAERATCLWFSSGCVIVKDGQVEALGYNGAPKGLPHCSVLGCSIDRPGLDASREDPACRGVHAEQNAIVQAGIDKCRGATLYVNGIPCRTCAKLIIQSEIGRVVITGERPEGEGMVLLRQAGIEVVFLDLAVEPRVPAER